MWVLHPLQHLQLIVYHLLISLDIFLEDDLDRYLSGRAVCFSDDTVRASTERFSKFVLRSSRMSARTAAWVGFIQHTLLIVALRLAMQLVQHV